MTARQQVLGGRDREEKESLSAAEDETRKRRERAQVVGLFRYQLSCPATGGRVVDDAARPVGV